MENITAIGEILFDVYANKKTLGGAPFNFIYHIINLTGKGNFVSRIGEDDFGNEILSILKERNISTGFIQIDEVRPTGIAKPILNEKKIPEWVIETERAYDFIGFDSEISHLINKQTDCLYFGTLAQRNEVSRRTIQSFFSNQIKFFCDLNIRQNFYTKEILNKSLFAADVLKINTDELQIINNELFRNGNSLSDLPKKLINDFNIELLCLTKGEEGAELFTKEEHNALRIKAEKIVDTVGAGDAYASILCIGFLQKWELKKINETASCFANEILKVNGALPDDNSVYQKFKETF